MRMNISLKRKQKSSNTYRNKCVQLFTSGSAASKQATIENAGIVNN
jgi:hypothetical protein